MTETEFGFGWMMGAGAQPIIFFLEQAIAWMLLSMGFLLRTSLEVCGELAAIHSSDLALNPPFRACTLLEPRRHGAMVH
jgi:hypothetical protein